MDAKDNISTVLDISLGEQIVGDGFPIKHESYVDGNSSFYATPVLPRPIVNAPTHPNQPQPNTFTPQQSQEIYTHVPNPSNM